MSTMPRNLCMMLAEMTEICFVRVERSLWGYSTTMRSRVFGKDLPLKHMKTMATGSESRVRLGIAEPEQDGVVGFDEPCEDDAVFPTKAEATIAETAGPEPELKNCALGTPTETYRTENRPDRTTLPPMLSGTGQNLQRTFSGSHPRRRKPSVDGRYSGAASVPSTGSIPARPNSEVSDRRRAIETATTFGFKRMIDSPLETTVGTGAAARPAPIPDTVSLDGPCRIVRQIGDGTELRHGRILYPEQDGTGTTFIKQHARAAS